MSTDVHTLSGAFALHALEPDETAEVVEHLASCESCSAEVAEFVEVAARMGAIDSQVPSAALRARVLSAVDVTAQERPRAAVEARLAGAEDELSARRRSKLLPRLAVAAAVLITVGGGVLGVQATQNGSEPSLVAAATRVFDADDARTTVIATSNGGAVTVGVSAARQEMAVDTSRLPALPSSSVYQLWSIRGGVSTSAAVLQDPKAGAAMALPAADASVAVTVEPVGGSTQPTTEAIFTVAASSI